MFRQIPLISFAIFFRNEPSYFKDRRDTLSPCLAFFSHRANSPLVVERLLFSAFIAYCSILWRTKSKNVSSTESAFGKTGGGVKSPPASFSHRANFRRSA